MQTAKQYIAMLPVVEYGQCIPDVREGGERDAGCR